MEISTHILIFILAAAVIWFFAGLLVESVDRVAKRFHKNGFTVAFFILGLLTSLSEISVAVNASIERSPQVSVGNLVGASLVILLLIVPILAVVGNGIALKNMLSQRNLFLALAVILAPAILVIDGDVTRAEGLAVLLAYVTLLFAIRGHRDSQQVAAVIEENLLENRKLSSFDGLKLCIGGVFIFAAGHLLVEQALYFSNYFGVPGSLIGLLLLSVGTNVPELVIAVRSVLQRRNDIAFGNYLGSAAGNTLIFGLLALANGRFILTASTFAVTAALMVSGFAAFFVFARSKNTISRKEGIALLIFYAVFLVVQFMSISGRSAK